MNKADSRLSSLSPRRAFTSFLLGIWAVSGLLAPPAGAQIRDGTVSNWSGLAVTVSNLLVGSNGLNTGLILTNSTRLTNYGWAVIGANSTAHNDYVDVYNATSSKLDKPSASTISKSVKPYATRRLNSQVELLLNLTRRVIRRDAARVRFMVWSPLRKWFVARQSTPVGRAAIG